MPLEENTHYVFGESLEKLDPDILPKELCVIRYIVHCFDVSHANVPRMDKKKRRSTICNLVVGDVVEIWKRQSLGIRSHRAVYHLVNKLIDRIDYVKVSKRYHENNIPWIQEVIKEHDKVFDIAEKPVKEELDQPMDVDVPEVIEEDLGPRKRKIPKWLENTDYEVNSFNF